MRVWDVPVNKLCRQHLLGQHNEIHAIWNIITLNKKGYAKHPEVMRWRNHLLILYNRHFITAKEMLNRGYNHKSPINNYSPTDDDGNIELINSVDEQIQILKNKGCKCRV